MRAFSIKSLRNWITALVFVMATGGALLTIATPQMVSADCNSNFLGLPAWYNHLKMDSNCNIKSPTGDSAGLSDFILTIGFNIIQMGLVVVAYISGFYFLYGGWLFILSQGKPEGIVKGKSTMTMALIGLVVSIAAVALVNFIVSKVIP